MGGKTIKLEEPMFLALILMALIKEKNVVFYQVVNVTVWIWQWH